MASCVVRLTKTHSLSAPVLLPLVIKPPDLGVESWQFQNRKKRENNELFGQIWAPNLVFDMRV